MRRREHPPGVISRAVYDPGAGWSTTEPHMYRLVLLIFLDAVLRIADTCVETRLLDWKA